MANQKMNVEIEDFEDKKSQNGKRYTRFKTNYGWMSAFEKEIIDSLKDAEGKEVCVEVATDEEKGFKNIRKYIGEAEELPEKAIKPQEFGRTAPVIKDTTTMYVSYAKDIFISVWPNWASSNETKPVARDVMNQCIELVKQAKSSFENGNNTKPNTDNKQE